MLSTKIEKSGEVRAMHSAKIRQKAILLMPDSTDVKRLETAAAHILARGSALIHTIGQEAGADLHRFSRPWR
jgi:hypothetical protein